MRTKFCFLAAAILWLAACAGGRAKPLPAPAGEVVRPGTGEDIRVTLLWAEHADLDLYVTDPTQETVYFANTSSGTGGALRKDIRCSEKDTKGPRRETVTWKRARPGHYRVGVDFSDPCGRGPAEVEYRVIADVRGRRLERVGQAKPATFEYVALEFDVAEP